MINLNYLIGAIAVGGFLVALMIGEVLAHFDYVHDLENEIERLKEER